MNTNVDLSDGHMEDTRVRLMVAAHAYCARSDAQATAAGARMFAHAARRRWLYFFFVHTS